MNAEPAAVETGPTTADAGASIEAIVLTSEKPVAPGKLREALAAVGVELDGAGLDAALDRLNVGYADDARSFRIEKVAGGYRAMATEAVAPALAAFHGARSTGKLSRAALETLAIVAYRQPVTRAEVEAIRGVASGEVIRSLLERRLLTIAGRAEELGRPMLYGTSKEFLASFGLGGIGDLPAMEGIPSPPAAIEPSPEPAEEPAEEPPTQDATTQDRSDA